MMRLSVNDLEYCKKIKKYDSDKGKYPFITYFPESVLSKEAAELDKLMVDNAKPLVDSQPQVDKLRQLDAGNAVPLTSCHGFDVSDQIIESLNCIKVEPKFATNNNGNSMKNGFILFVHGGGFIAGTQHGHFVYPLSRYTGCTVYVIDYNLAPDTSINDTMNNIIKIYDYIILNNNNNWNENNGVLIGDSAGGSYVLLVLQRLRDRLKNNQKAIGLPCCVFVKSPWTDLNNKYTKECHKYNDKLDAILTTKGLKHFIKSAIKNEMKEMQGVATTRQELLLDKYSAINDDFDDLTQCSMYFVVSASEVLLDDTILCAKKAFDKNVNVSVELHPFLWHACIYQAHLCQEALAIMIRVSQWINQQLNNKRKHLPLSAQLKSML